MTIETTAKMNRIDEPTTHNAIDRSPVGVIKAAIQCERYENPDCPQAQQMEDLLGKYLVQKDEEALLMALQMAYHTFQPNILTRIGEALRKIATSQR